MAKTKRLIPVKQPYVSSRFIRDAHLVIFLLGNYWYWDRFYGFNQGFYSFPTFLDLLPLTIGWTILLIIHFWLFHRLKVLSAENENLRQTLAESAANRLEEMNIDTHLNKINLEASRNQQHYS